MKFDLFLNDLENRLTVFKTELDVQTWMTRNGLKVTVSTYQAIINAGEKHIKESIDKTIKDIEMDVLLHKINLISNLKSFGMNEDDKFMIGFLGIGGAIGFCLISSIALVPALAVGGLVYWFAGNSILQKNICEKLLKSSKDTAKKVKEQIEALINEDADSSAPQKQDLIVHDSFYENLSIDQLEIKSFLEKRKIKYLVHFTNSKNIDSIKQHGILSVQELNRLGIRFNNNDENRYDHMLDYISLSVTQPNKYVLKKFKENGTLSEVSLIYIDSAILYEEISTPRVYCDRNAAKGSCQKGSSLSDFENMFSNNKEYDRYEHYRDDNEPTDTQAEILFNKKVDVKYIKRIVQLWG